MSPRFSTEVAGRGAARDVDVPILVEVPRGHRAGLVGEAVDGLVGEAALAIAPEEGQAAVEEPGGEVDEPVAVEVGRLRGEEGEVAHLPRQLGPHLGAEGARAVVEAHDDPGWRLEAAERDGQDGRAPIARDVDHPQRGRPRAQWIERRLREEAIGLREAHARVPGGDVEEDHVVPPVIVKVAHGHVGHLAVEEVELVEPPEAHPPGIAGE
jgi:hypothetical protein